MWPRKETIFAMIDYVLFHLNKYFNMKRHQALWFTEDNLHENVMFLKCKGMERRYGKDTTY